MTHPLFAPLQAAYDDRLALAARARAAGRRVVGYVGNTVPVELILAAGAVPLRIAPVAGDASAADAHVEAFSDRDLRLTFAAFCSGALDALDLLVIPRSSETQHKLYLSLREARRTGITSHGPALWLYDILHTQRESSRAYGLARTHDLAQRLAAVTGIAPAPAAIADAAAQTNALRRELLRLQQRRAERAISGREVLVATGAVRFMAPEAGAAALRAWLAADVHAACQGPRLLVTGCALDHAALHAQVECAGGRIVAENDEWGSRAAEPLIATDAPPLEAVFDHHWRDVPCLRRHPAPAVDAWLAGWLDRGRIDGVLFHLPPPDDLHGWRLPAQRDAAIAAGLPRHVVRHDARDGSVPGLADFIRTLAR